MAFQLFTSPLRYPGGKGSVAGLMKSVIATNGLFDATYVEPFAGGAAIAWSLLFEEYVTRVCINDISASICAFWDAVLYNTDALSKLVLDTTVTIEEWNRQKDIFIHPKAHSSLELGFSAFFLNRTNRSGILTGGVIGGKAQEGQWKLDARFNKTDLVARIQRIARYTDRITVHNMDASNFIQNILPAFRGKTLIYLDPPYYSRGQDLYENRYSPEDHFALSTLVTQHIRQPWIVSYDTTPEILRMYAGYPYVRYRLSYSAQTRYSGREVMFFSRSLCPPAGHKVLPWARPFPRAVL